MTVLGFLRGFFDQYINPYANALLYNQYCCVLSSSWGSGMR